MRTSKQPNRAEPNLTRFNCNRFNEVTATTATSKQPARVDKRAGSFEKRCQLIGCVTVGLGLGAADVLA